MQVMVEVPALVHCHHRVLRLAEYDWPVNVQGLKTSYSLLLLVLGWVSHVRHSSKVMLLRRHLMMVGTNEIPSGNSLCHGASVVVIAVMYHNFTIEDGLFRR